MTKSKISQRIAADRTAWIERMLHEIRALPLEDAEAFFADTRNVWAAESCLRRAIEALLDLGRHLLAKGFGVGVTEYKQIAGALLEAGVVDAPVAEFLTTLAGYRNRLVHFYHEVSQEELHGICSTELADIEAALSSLKHWLRNHPEFLDTGL